MSYKHKNPSASRNQGPILDILKNILDRNKTNLKLLEISSGTGQHAAHIGDYFNNITIQPSELDKSMLPSIQCYARNCKNKNVKDPVLIDISMDYETWNLNYDENEFDYMLNINMIHISPMKCTEGLFKNAAKLLKSKGLLITYGPYAVDGILTPESNVRFNAMLKTQNPEWGVRDMKILQTVSLKYGIHLKEYFDMPANNKIIIWTKN